MTDAQVLENLLEKARTVPAPELPAFLGAIETARVVALSRLQSPAPAPRSADELLSVAEASRRLGVSKHYLYRHNDFPFVRRMGKKLLFSARGLESYINSKKT